VALSTSMSAKRAAAGPFMRPLWCFSLSIRSAIKVTPKQASPPSSIWTWFSLLMRAMVVLKMAWRLLSSSLSLNVFLNLALKSSQSWSVAVWCCAAAATAAEMSKNVLLLVLLALLSLFMVMTRQGADEGDTAASSGLDAAANSGFPLSVPDSAVSATGMSAFPAAGASMDSADSAAEASAESSSGALPADGSARLTIDALIENAARLLSRYDQEVWSQISPAPCGVGWVDGLALVSLIDLMGIEVLIESGTSVGQSTELLARFFTGRAKVITVDFGDVGPSSGAKPGVKPKYIACAANVSLTHKRLRQFGNVQALLGDSFKLFPQLLAEHRGKRIGLFIDGPKGPMAAQLCAKALKVSTDVRFCAFHDAAPDLKYFGKNGPLLLDLLGSWNRTIGRLCCDGRWQQTFGTTKQDGVPFCSVAIAEGTATAPWGRAGDDKVWAGSTKHFKS